VVSLDQVRKQTLAIPTANAAGNGANKQALIYVEGSYGAPPRQWFLRSGLDKLVSSSCSFAMDGSTQPASPRRTSRSAPTRSTAARLNSIQRLDHSRCDSFLAIPTWQMRSCAVTLIERLPTTLRIHVCFDSQPMCAAQHWQNALSHPAARHVKAQGSLSSPWRRGDVTALISM